jgi:Clostridial hydrophobic W
MDMTTIQLVGRLSTAAWLALGLMGCGGDLPGAEETGVAQLPVRNGTPTTQRPEVLMMNSPAGCTATLIGARDFLTAAHCIRTGPLSGEGGFTVTNFQNRGGNLVLDTGTPCPASGCAAGFFCDINNGPGGVCAANLAIDRTFPQGVHLGADDLAVGRLAAAVPGTVPTPAQVASTQPSNTDLTIMGYGCIQPSIGDFGVKRFVTYFFSGGTSANHCPGDSGGPTFVGTLAANGPIARIVSGMSLFTGADIGADAVTYRSQILAMAAALEGSNVSYRGQVQGIGFQAAVTNGVTAGIPGQNRRLEALQIWSPVSTTANPVTVCYQAQVQNQGWQAQQCDGNVIGTVGQGLRMEALQITLPRRGPFTRIRYSANVEGVWQSGVVSDVACTSSNAATMCGSGLCFNGRCAAGTVGQSKKIEGVQITIE